MVSECCGLYVQVARKFHESGEEVEPVLANKSAARDMSEYAVVFIPSSFTLNLSPSGTA
jgi:hypothetical protein